MSNCTPYGTEYTFHNVSMPISNPEVEARNMTDGIVVRMKPWCAKSFLSTGNLQIQASQEFVGH